MQIEKYRQLIHLILGSIFILVTIFLGNFYTLIFSGILFLAGVLISKTLRSGCEIPVIHHWSQKVQRKHEKHWPGRGALFFVAGIALSAFIFQDQIILIAALAVSTYGDFTSTMTGKTFGRTRIGNLTLEGTIGGIIVSAAVLFLLFQNPLLALGIAVVAMAMEYLPIDDSFTIPLMTGILLTFLI